MIKKPMIGTLGVQQFAVEAGHAIDFADSQLPAVLSTPALVGFLERTARETLRPFLEETESSVGVEIDLTHLAPTPVGSSVRCQSRIVHLEGSRVAFQIEAWDAQELVAKGFHKRQVIRKARFAQRVARKTPRQTDPPR